MRLPCGHDFECIRDGYGPKGEPYCVTCGMSLQVLQSPSPDVPESVGQQGEFLAAIQALCNSIDEVPNAAAVRALGNVRWCLQVLDRRTKGHAPTQLPAPGSYPIDCGHWSHDVKWEAGDKQSYVCQRCGAEFRFFGLNRLAPSTTATGQSLSVPPATEGSAAAVPVEELEALLGQWIGQLPHLKELGKEAVRGCYNDLHGLIQKAKAGEQ